MDNDYNTLEKWLDDLGEDCEKTIQLFKQELLKIVMV